MELPDGRPLTVLDGVACEPSPDGRVILWMPGERDGGYRRWDRVGTVARAAVAVERGVCSIAATSVPARERLGGPLGRLLGVVRGRGGGPTWTIPGGATAEGCGPRRADLVLAWAEEGAAPLDEARVRARWPGCGAVRAVGHGLYLVAGVGPGPAPVPAAAAPEAAPPRPHSRVVAERALEAARGAGDEAGAVTAAIDLGVAWLADGDAHRAARLFKGALDDARRLGDEAREADALLNFALAAQVLGHFERARDLLVPVLARARAAGDRYAEKLALGRLAQVQLGLGDRTGALGRLEEARAAAAATADRRHEAELLWRAAVEHAELGHRDATLAAAGAAVALWRGLRHPAAEWYARHLAKFRAGAARVPPPASDGPSLLPATLAAPESPPTPAVPEEGPGLLRMALTATQAMAKFVGSGFKTTPESVYRERLAACGGCAHHTGLRCRACGCVTAAKARLLHEQCPAGRWPA